VKKVSIQLNPEKCMVEFSQNGVIENRLKICTIHKNSTSLYGNQIVYEEFKKLPITIY
jgi:hypothetical protein